MFKVTDTLFSKIPTAFGLGQDSTTFTRGHLVYHDTSTGTLKEASSSVGLVTNIVGIVNKTQTTTTGQYIQYTPVITGAVFVTADCTNATAANQLWKQQVLTDAGTINNSSTTTSTTAGVFMPTALVGASTANQLYGYFIRIGQVDA